MSFYRFAATLLVSWGALALPGCGAGDALVGGECGPGYAQCDFACVDLANDPDNCGGCGTVCQAGTSCVASACVAHATDVGDAGGAGDAGETGLSSTDGAPPATVVGPVVPVADAGSGGDGGASSPGDAAADAATGDDGSTVDGAPLGDGATYDASDAADAPDSSPCAPPLTACSSQCSDETTDPNNCGTCGKICPSNLCGAGLCLGETPGDDIVIGHDYASALPGTAEARVLSNAVLLPSSNPVRILSFERYADPASVARVKAILTAGAAAEGKSIVVTVATSPADMPVSLSIASYDTLLIYDQAEALPGTLAALGTSWAPELATFLGAGGDVVTLDGAAGTTAEMPLFESNAGLLAVTSHTLVASGTPLSVAAPGDSVALGVLDPYGAVQSTARFSTTEPSGASVAYVVVEPSSGQPVVVHKTIPGR